MSSNLVYLIVLFGNSELNLTPQVKRPVDYPTDNIITNLNFDSNQ